MLAWLEQFLVRYPELAMAPWPRVLTIAVLVNLAFALSTAAQSHTSLGPGLNETLASERPASWSRLGDRLNRRKACRQQRPSAAFPAAWRDASRGCASPVSLCRNRSPDHRELSPRISARTILSRRTTCGSGRPVRCS